MNLFENPLVVAKHVAEREIRSAFQARYGAFWKCPTCGGYTAPVGTLFKDEYPYWCGCATGPSVRAGYAPRPSETIAAAAILIDGKVWSVPPPGRHHNVICLYVFGSPVHPPADDAPELRKFLGKNGEQGFLTSTGRFVDRREGLRIAVAARQYRTAASSYARHHGIGYEYTGSELYSEDVW